MNEIEIHIRGLEKRGLKNIIISVISFTFSPIMYGRDTHDNKNDEIQSFSA